MGKKREEKHLGRILIKDRFGVKDRRKKDSECFLHNVDMQDGYDWGLLNLQSVTEESSFQEFLSTAELAGTEFQAEKLNIKFVSLKSDSGLLSKEKYDEILKSQDENRKSLKIPRKPKWDKSMTAQELQTKEKEEILQWRKQLALLQEMESLTLTPYEKNLEFWRQLWRVIERSDVVVQIVDARNPLLFRCKDLEQYVKEVNPNKVNFILINKADFLTAKQREIWAEYFSKCNMQVAFFSATLATQEDNVEDGKPEENSGSKNVPESTPALDDSKEYEHKITNDNLSDAPTKSTEAENSKNIPEEKDNEEVNSDKVKNSSNLLTRTELISLLKTVYPEENRTSAVLTVGFVGYPNVGKSSTLNALLMSKKVSVSATPGKTKHFQTIYLEENLILCDCPGLVMPNFVSTKAEMILNGILPINQMRDHKPPISLLASLIPRHVLEDLYGIMIPLPLEGEDPDRSPTAEELLNIHGFNRGFMTQNGQPDNARSARYILKDFVNGKLLYSVAPPDYNQNEFRVFLPKKTKKLSNSQQPPRAIKATKTLKTTTEDIDKVFFQNNTSGLHVKGRTNSTLVNNLASTSAAEKPWKKINKHANKKKREKSRRLYAHLDN